MDEVVRNYGIEVWELLVVIDLDGGGFRETGLYSAWLKGWIGVLTVVGGFFDVGKFAEVNGLFDASILKESLTLFLSINAFPRVSSSE